MKVVADAALHDAGVVFRLSDERGNVGLGEASPLPGRSRETTAQALAALKKLHVESLDGIETDLPSARFAAETALLDLLGKRDGVPAWRLLGGHGTRIPLNALVSSVEDAKRAARRGIRTLKAKLGAPLDEIREALPGVALRLDANGRLSPEEARALPAWLEYVEQPCRSLQGLSLAATIAADESVIEEPEVALSVARVLVLKPTLLGGWRATIAMAERAFAAGIDVVVTHALEGPIARAACASIALALPRPPRACGLDAHAGLRAWPPMSAPWIGDAWIDPHLAPGLGLQQLMSDMSCWGRVV